MLILKIDPIYEFSNHWSQSGSNFLTLEAYKSVLLSEIGFEGNEKYKYKRYFWEDILEQTVTQGDWWRIHQNC